MIYSRDMNESKEKNIDTLINQNADLLKENNTLLKKIHRQAVITLWLRVLWYIVLIGLPFALFFILEPYFEALGSNYNTFQAGIGEIPGLKNLNVLLEQYGISSTSPQ